MSEFEWIDDCFRVENQKWGTCKSYDKNNVPIITSLCEEVCISATRSYLKMKQDGFQDSKTYEGNVSGKL